MPRKDDPKTNTDDNVGAGDNALAGTAPVAPIEARQAGAQFGEAPGPIPAEELPRTPPPPPAPDLAPRTDVKPIQEAPVVVGTHRVVQDTAPRDPSEAPLTAPAVRLATVDSFGLTKLARQAYGDENLALWIFEANRDTLTSPDQVRVGATVRIPDAPEGHPSRGK